ncbi:MAG: lytic transglycosylase domain-containing protein [Negativicutes bacterium]|nr:lytic transglycosylase domain-containing protein [Negativicutes bacterium]
MSISSAYANVTNANTARESSREALALKKRELDFAMTQAGYDPNSLNVIPGSNADVQAQQNQQMIQMNKALQGKLAAQETDQAFLDYSETGDASYLQRAMEGNDLIKRAWMAKGVQNVTNIDWQNDTQLLDRSGFKPSFYDTPEKQDVLKKNVYKVYDGKDWKIGLLNNVVMETGAMRRLGKNRGQPLIDNFQVFRDLLASPRVSPNTAEGHKYEKEIRAASQETGVPPNLIAAMISQESKGKANAVSEKGATGLMQLMPDTATEMGVSDLTDPAQNIMGGAKYLAKQLEAHNGNLALALASYNAGPTAVADHGGIPPYQETQNYVSKIMSNYRKGERHYNQADELGLVTNGRVNALDERINTIRNFLRENANAAKGTTSANVDQAVMDNTLATQAAAITARAKMMDAANPKTKLTEKQKNLNAAQEKTQDLLNEFGGEEEFFKTDFTDQKNFNKAWKNVVQINELEGTTLSNEDKKSITDIRGLINLASPASKLTPQQTGLLDSRLSGLSKYISDNAPNIDKKAAMASFRNTLRNALYGSTLTDGEIAAFNEAFGDNTQKLGPVLDQFKVALSQVQEKLASISNMGNPYTMRVLVGADEQKLQGIRDALQQRIDYFSGKYDPEEQKKAARKPIDEIFGTPKGANQ